MVKGLELRFLLLFFLIVQLMSAQTSSGDEDAEFILVDKLNLFNEQKEKKANYHEGALLVLDLNMDARKLKSTFCLSCHDGVFATQGHSTTNIGNPENIDGNSIFSFNHPVAFEYSSKLALSKNYLNDPYTTDSGFGGTVAEDLLVDGKIECITCHNVYYERGETLKYGKLNKSNNGSDLCFMCHNR